MVIIVQYEEIKKLLEDNMDAWMQVGGGPNMDAFEFDPNIVDLSVLDAKGYYTNRDSWIAGVQIKKIQEYLNKSLQDPARGAQNNF